MSSIIASPAVGFASQGARNVFDDLQDIGAWPAEQRIKKISQIQVHYNNGTAGNTFTGIRVTYDLVTGGTRAVLHGVTGDANPDTIDVTDKEYFVGIFGALDASNNALLSLGFLVYNEETGSVDRHGPDGATASNTRGFTRLGLIVAFGGNLSSVDETLETLTVYKKFPGVDGLNII